MKKVMLVLSIALIISTFSACKDSTVTESSSESATSKVFAITTTSETELVAETNAVTSEITLTVSETQSETEISPESVSEKKLNLDLLSDIGLIYGEIRAKHGDVKDFFKLPSGSFCYVFTQGYIGYLWGFDKVESSSENILFPNGEEECQNLLIFEAKDLFLGLNSSVNPAELVKMYGVTHISSGYNAHDECYFSSFELANKYFYVETKESEIIAPNSSIQISLIFD